MTAVLADDIVLTSDAPAYIRERIHRVASGRPASLRMTQYGSTQIPDLDIISNREVQEMASPKQVQDFARFAVRVINHADYIAKNPSMFLPMTDANESNRFVTIRHAGIETRWELAEVYKFVNVKRSVIDKVLSAVTNEGVYSDDTAHTFWTMSHPNLSEDFVGNPANPLLQRAIWQTRQARLYAACGDVLTVASVTNPYVRRFMPLANNLVIYGRLYPSHESVSLHAYFDALRIVDAFNQPVTAMDVRQARDGLLQSQANFANKEVAVRRQLAAENFSKYWESLKRSKREVDYRDAALHFSQIPIPAAGTTASRTWGIEVETVRADGISAPVGWEREHDGSLDSDIDCSCDCDNCVDYSEHCESSYDGCQSTEAAEFVSPILRSFNSRGLRELCDQIPTREDNTTPGIHVHVNGNDLSVSDVARLVVAYSAIEPLFEPLYHREERGYCKPMTTDNLRHWLANARRQTTDSFLPSATQVALDQPDTRYDDVNLHALSKHGTVEFRAMGPFYDYDHLVRWAWICRELVNVSKLGLDQRIWTGCNSVADVVKVLRAYGSELPIYTQYDKLDTSTMEMQEDDEFDDKLDNN